jgi:arginine:agmatine antiporter
MIRNRKIGPVLATLLVASNMVGSGIYLLPATLATVGSITVVGWVMATIGALLVAAVLGRLAHLAPAAGGPLAYAGEALGPFVGFQTNVIYWVCCWVGNIAIAVAAVGYLASFFTSLSTPLNAAIGTAALIWVLTFANVLGPRLVCQLQGISLAIGLIPIVLVMVVGWVYFDPDIFRASWNVQQAPAYEVIPRSLVLVFWAFIGLESASVATDVVENPRRNVVIATLGGVALSGVVYIASSSVIMGVLPAAELAKSSAPFADAVRVMLGPVAGAAVALMAATKAIGTLAGWILLTAQTGKTAADRGFFPRIFARTDAAGIPVANLLLMATLMTFIVFGTISPTLGQQFGKLIDVSTVLCLLVYLYACTAIWHYRESGPDSASATRYRWIALAAMAFCMFVIATSDVTLLALSAAIVLFTVPLYPFVTRAAWVNRRQAGARLNESLKAAPVQRSAHRVRE